MKRQKRLTVLLAVLAVCIAGAFGISRIDFEEKMTGTETEIINVDSAEITYLAWNYDGEVAFTYEDEEWKYESDDAMPVDQEKLSDIAEDLSSITSDKRVEDVSSLGIYGLDSPAYTFTVKTADETWEISIGDESFTDGEVYISTGDDYVYLTDSELIDKISYTLYDLVQTDEIPEAETVTAMNIDNENSLEIIYQEDNGYCYSDEYTYFLKDGEDDYRNLDNENTETMFDTLSAFSWEECVSYNADDSALESYGLDDPEAVVQMSYTDEEGESHEFSYELAKVDDTCYARVTDSQIVCTVSSGVYDAAVNASYDELKPGEVILLNWTTVDSIDIETDGNRYTVEVESSGGDDEETEYTFTLDGQEVEFMDALDELSGITAAEDVEEEISLGSSKEEIKITFHRNTEDYTEVELVFYQYDGTYCIPVLDGEEMDPVNREDVVSLKEAVNSVVLDSAKEE